MSPTTTLAVCASAWGVAMALSPLLQVRAIRLNGSSRGVSIGYQTVLLVGFVLWLGYAVTIDNVALMIPNAIALVVSATTIAIAWSYR